MYSQKSGSKTSFSRRFQNLPSRVVTQQTVHGETLVHWYKTHNNGGLHSNLHTIYTEESDDEYIIIDERFHSRFPFILCNPYARYYMRVQKVRAYRHYLQNTLEDVFRLLRWIDLPGGQDRVAVERNYLMNYIWLMGFVVSEVDTTQKDTARHIRYRLEELLVHAENMGIILQQYFVPLAEIAQKHACVEEMGDQLQFRKIPRPRAEKKILRLAIKPDSTMLSGNKVQDFSKLLIYTRKDCQVWTRFRSLSESDKVDIVTKGLMEITDTIKDLRIILKKPLRAIKSGSGHFPYGCVLPTLASHVEIMTQDLKQIMSTSKNEIDSEHRNILEALLTEVITHYGYILRYSELMVEEIWDIILMVRLTYGYVKESPQNTVGANTLEMVLKSRLRKRKLKRLIKPSSFSKEDFYKAECPDTLRKLPIVVFPANAEMSLHLQGHRNSHRSKSFTPAHKFSLIKRRSIPKNMSDPDDTEVPSPTALSTTSVPNKLMFVSEGD